MWVQTDLTLKLTLPTEAALWLMLRPRSGDGQWVQHERYVMSPQVPVFESQDPFGNIVQRLVVPAGPFEVSTHHRVACADAHDHSPTAPFVPVQRLPAEVLPFLLPSRYCEADQFTDLAGQLAAGRTPGFDQVAAIVGYVQATTAYRPGEGEPWLSAVDVNQRTHGVCRDLSHLTIALCRALAIPARLVVGYLEALTPMDLHAWAEVYVGDRWYTVDPSAGGLSQGRVVLAYGRDAADVALLTQFGPPAPGLQVDLQVRRCEGPA